MSLPYLVFDMDGVLAEVSESYREAVVQTVRHFTGKTVERERIQEYKNRGGFNNDWLLSQQLCRDFGVEVPYDTVVEHFCAIFFGPRGDDGLIAREVWLPRPGLLNMLAARFSLAIFTGRLQREAAITLRRYAPDVHFSPIIAAEMIYVGDTVDDARCSRAASVPFIGIAAPSNPLNAELAALLGAEGAVAVLDDVNQIEGALAQCAAPRSNE